MRIHEIEIDILFKLIWSQRDGAKCLAFAIFTNTNFDSDLAIKRILVIMAERLYLITSELVLDIKLRDIIWSILKKLLLYGFDVDTEDLDISFKTNIHIDLLLLSSVYHVIFMNNTYINMGKLIMAYSTKITFPLLGVLTDFQTYYKEIFKKKMKEFSDDPTFNCKVNPASQAKQNTPIQVSVNRRKKIILQSTFESTLPVALEKRTPESFQRHDGPIIPQFMSDHKSKIPKLNFLSHNESPINPISLASISPFSSRVQTPNESPISLPFFQQGTVNPHFDHQSPQDESIVMENTGIQTPTFK
jgi:hypothetical protein